MNGIWLDFNFFLSFSGFRKYGLQEFHRLIASFYCMFLLKYFKVNKFVCFPSCFGFDERVINLFWSFPRDYLFNYLISAQIILFNFTYYFYLQYVKFQRFMKLLYFNYHRICKKSIILISIRKVILFDYFNNFNFYQRNHLYSDLNNFSILLSYLNYYLKILILDYYYVHCIHLVFLNQNFSNLFIYYLIFLPEFVS